MIALVKRVRKKPRAGDCLYRLQLAARVTLLFAPILRLAEPSNIYLQYPRKTQKPPHTRMPLPPRCISFRRVTSSPTKLLECAKRSWSLSKLSIATIVKPNKRKPLMPPPPPPPASLTFCRFVNPPRVVRFPPACRLNLRRLHSNAFARPWHATRLGSGWRRWDQHRQTIQLRMQAEAVCSRG